MRKPFLFLAVSLLTVAPAAAQYAPPPRFEDRAHEPVLAPVLLELRLAGEPLQLERPPLSAGRIAGQTLAGIGGGLLATVGTSLVLLPLLTEPGEEPWGVLAAVGLGLLIGYPLGTTGGVYLAGQVGNQTGSFLATFGGAAAGALAGLLLGPYTGGLSYLVLVPAGAVTGFNLTRRYSTPPAAATR